LINENYVADAAEVGDVFYPARDLLVALLQSRQVGAAGAAGQMKRRRRARRLRGSEMKTWGSQLSDPGNSTYIAAENLLNLPKPAVLF